MATTITHTIKLSGGDYSSLAAWEAAQINGVNLVALDQIRQAECYAFEDTTGLTIDGATSADSTRYARVYVASGNGHGGIAGVGYRIKANPASVDDCLVVADPYVRIEGVEFDCSLNVRGVRVNADQVRVVGCLVHDWAGYGTNSRGIWNTGAFTWYAVNNILYNGLASGSFCGGLYQEDGTAYWYNNTVYNAMRAYNRQGGTVVAKNNIAQASNTTAFQGTYAAGTTNNIADLATVPGTNGKVATVSFVNTGTRNLHLDPSDTQAIGYGVDLSGDSIFPFTNDIDGQTRSGSWDAGADEYVTAGTSITVSASPLSGTYSLSNPSFSLDGAVLAPVLSGLFSLAGTQFNTNVTVVSAPLSGTFELSNPSIGIQATVQLGILSATFTVASPVVTAGGQTIVTEDFSGTGSLGSGWIIATGGLQRNSGQLAGTTGNYNVAYRSETFGDDQFSKVIATVFNADYIILAVRQSGQSSTWSGYHVFTNGPGENLGIERVNNNVATRLLSTELTTQVGDELELRVNGHILSFLVNGVEIASYDDSASSDRIDSGAPGVGTYRISSRADDWEGGDFGDGQNDAEFAVGVLSATYSFSDPQLSDDGAFTVGVLSGTFSLRDSTTYSDIYVVPQVLSATYSLREGATYSDIYVVPQVLSASYTFGTPSTNSSLSVVVGASVLSATYSLREGATYSDIYVIPQVLSATFGLRDSTTYSDIYVIPQVLSASYSFSEPLTNNGVSVAFTAGVLSATFGLRDSTTYSDIYVIPQVLSASYSLQSASTVSGSGVTISMPVLSGSYSISSPTVLFGVSIQVNPITGTYSFRNPVIVSGTGINVSTTVLSGSYSLVDPIIDAGGSVTVQMPILSGTYSYAIPEIRLGVTISTGILSGTFGMDGHAALSNNDALIVMPILSGTYSVPNVMLGVGVTISVPVLSGSINITSVNIRRDNNFDVRPLSATYSFPTPFINLGGLLIIKLRRIAGY